ncbi:MAG TPA: FAD-linked oxidase C-terminal domain-containing protein, partial [Oceanipulchritudo sp.]|nr:FAD-linked oxidase C-terminal domain-containing protein [Oceanipulchritudo sp.]
KIAAKMKAAGLGYAFPVLFGADTEKIWNLRKAGLGLLSNMPGDAKPVPVVEDTAVRVEDLPDYIREFNHRLKERFGIQCVHYAHAGSGEIHMRPIINLKTETGNRTFREVARTIAELVREYRGSLSGEHGDGRLRGEFLEEMIGARNYGLVVGVKRCWDPDGIFNPNKIVDTPPMNSHLRFVPGEETKEPDTLFDWSSTGGMLGAAEMCNGSGDCRKTHLSGGTMCPSYMATRHEKDTTRARANLLRQSLTEGPGKARRSVFDNPEVKEILDLCLSCKGCKKECPSTVDMARLKAEFMQHYLDANGVPLRTRMIPGYARLQALASRLPRAWNALFGCVPLRRILNRIVGFHPDRSIPLLPRQSLATWFRDHVPHPNAGSAGSVCFFNDEFTNYNDAPIGIKAIELLERLGYAVELPEVSESGRTWLSKGLVREARKHINANVRLLGEWISPQLPLVGVEPSGILTFVDEAPDLVDPGLRGQARRMAPHCYMVEAFIAREAAAGRVSPDAFTSGTRHLKLHAHCFQKALHGPRGSIEALSLPRNYSVELIPSGCCGMAGSFGYESEHYALSMQVGELVLFPAVRSAGESTLIAAPGTSCRHQIHDGTGRAALHPVEVLHEALA